MALRMSEEAEFVISNELSRMDVDLIHSYLVTAIDFRKSARL